MYTSFARERMGILTQLKRRWDSADPERAPPPLPLNPGTNSPTTRANTSAVIAAAAKKIVEASRDSAPLSSYVSNVTPLGSPERSLIKGAHHKRMQSLQPGSVKDLRNYLDNSRSPERSPERPATAERRQSTASGLSPFSSRDGRDYMSAMSPTPDREVTPTPSFLKETPSLRPSSRHSRIYGENTPPSATMLALQTMQVPEEPLADVTNRSGTPTTPRVNNNYDFSSQLLNLTTIATNLQKEMASLSRRSKDNATDLVHLKDATTARDEDIRRSLRTLTSSVTSQALLGAPPPPGLRSRSASITAPVFLESKNLFSSPPPVNGGYHVPRAASAHSFLDDGRLGSPSPYSVEGAASVAMLEKIIREMVTKEGQERLLGTLNELFEKSSKDNVEAARKVEELADFIKRKSESQAMVPMNFSADGGPPKLELNFGSPSALAKVREAVNAEGPKPAQDEEIMKLLQRIKDSITHAGGATSEVKGLVRDLRGEVLGMGRELGRKLDQVSETQLNATLDRSIEDNQGNLTAEEIHRVLEDGLNELKQQIHSMLQERAAHDDDSFRQLATTTSGPSGDEIFALVKHALSEQQETSPREVVPVSTGLERDDVLEAVKDGLKDFEPNIELQQFGLERDEIITVLKEGLEDYQNSRPEPAGPSIDKADVFEAIQEALKDFQPVSPDHLQGVRDDILGEVRLALEEFRASTNAPAVDDEATRAGILEAVRQGFSEQGPTREFDISRDDLFDAVKASIDGTTIPFNSFGEQVLQQLHELIGGMRVEFKQYSAANGRDTEQVLDAVKDGLESLRAEIESYVDRAQDVTGKDEIVDTIKDGLEQLRGDVQEFVAKGPVKDPGREQLLNYIKAEFEHLHMAVLTSREQDESKPDHHAANTAAIILAIQEGMEDLKSQTAQARGLNNEDDEDTREEMFEAMKEEFEQLKCAVLNAHATDKGELIETIQDSMGALHAKLEGSDLGTRSISEQEESIQMLRDDIAQLKEMVGTSAGPVDNEALVDGIKQTIDELRATLSADQNDASAMTVNMFKEELEKIQETLGSSMVVAGAGAPDNSEMLSALREGLEEIRESTSKSSAGDGVPTELLEAMRGEFEQLRSSINTTMVHGGSNEEVLDTVRLGLDDLRSHIEKKLDSPERTETQTNNMLDAINEGLETLRADVVKTLDKPADLTVNYEILDTLKDGLASLRVDIDLLKEKRPTSEPRPSGTELVLADTDGEQSRGLSAEDMAAAADASAAGAGVGAAAASQDVNLERMEVLLSQLQIKIEAMDAAMQDNMHATRSTEPAEGIATKVDLEGVEMAIRDMQDSVAAFASQVPAEASAPLIPEGLAMKEDTDAIEVLLQNMKEQVEVLALGDNNTAASKEHLEMVEGVVVITKEAIDELSGKIEGTVAGKEDLAAVEVLAHDVKTMLEELKEKIGAEPSEEEQALRVTKADLDVLGVICTEIKEKVDSMDLPDPTEVPTKADVEQLQGLIADFRESHDKMKDSYESDIAITAKAFDDRKNEFQDTVQHIEDVKTSLVEIKEELIAKLTEGETGMNTLGETLKSLEESTNNEDMNADVREILETVKAEFEKAHDVLEAMKTDGEQNAALSFEKQGEHKEATVLELTGKLDQLFDGMMSKFDDAQTAADNKAKAVEEQVAAQDELFNNTKVMADDLKLSIDTLGTALTTFTSTYPDAVDKAAEDSKTVFNRVDDTYNKLDAFTSAYPEAIDKAAEDSKTLFNRVDDTYNKLDETQQGLLHEHTVAREELDKVVAAVAAVQSDLTEHNPRFMMSLKEVQALINQHYEHSQQASETAAEHASAMKEFQEQIKASFEEARASEAERAEELKRDLPALLPPPEEPEKYDDSAVRSKLDQLVSLATLAADDKYDDAAVHSKLDELMGHAAKAADPSAQIERLDQIHEKVMATAAEVSVFVALQSKQIEEDHENKERETEEIALLLERRLVQKDQIESEITSLNGEKDSLRTLVEGLRAEREALASQKSKMQADVASLETALHIRRDELHAMDARAEQIEKRMLEGVMNQSRMMLLAKSARVPKPPSSPKKKPQGRDLRNPSNGSAMSGMTGVSAAPSSLKGTAKIRPPMARTAPTYNAAERRIMSLSQINNNVPTGAHAFKSKTPSLLSSNGGVSRSQSVRSNLIGKPTWKGSKRHTSLGTFNKENETLSEESESELESQADVAAYHEPEHEEFASDAGTERRNSHYSQSNSAVSYDDRNSYVEGPTPAEDSASRFSFDPSEYTYGTGSYMTGSEVDRRDSLESTINGTVGVPSTLEEEAELEDAATGAEQEDVSERLDHSEDGIDDTLLQLEAPPSIDEVIKGQYAPPSDSGLGTELPTVADSERGSDYFQH
jgi:chromosome segregation ATPase